MDDLEHKLKSMRLAMPSAELDRRIDDAVTAARRRLEASDKAAFWWWTAALSTAGGVMALLAVSAHRPIPVPEVAIYQIEPQGRMREMLLNSVMTGDAAPQFFAPIPIP